MRTLGIVLFALAASGCTDSSTSPAEDDGLAGCDRSSVSRWLTESDLTAYGLGERASRLHVDLPDTQPDLSARMKRELVEQCAEEVTVSVGPPTQPAS
jgi:hypothetical protein